MNSQSANPSDPGDAAGGNAEDPGPRFTERQRSRWASVLLLGRFLVRL
jgi:hypothetical protein